jgi:eukaryotic-like serine/threonine-protein kinase
MTTSEKQTLIGGRYLRTEMVALTADATTFDGTDVRTDRLVTIRLLHLPHEDMAARMRSERRAARVVHPGLAGAIDISPPGEPAWLVYERLVGETLSARLGRELWLEVDDVLDIGVQLLDALAALHDQALVHGDVSPANVFLAARAGCRPLVKLMEFGTAAFARDGRADLYAAGVSMFEALTGRLPRGDDAMSLAAMRGLLPFGLAAILTRATTFEPHGRFAGARGMLEALRSFVPPPPEERAPNTERMAHAL